MLRRGGVVTRLLPVKDFAEPDIWSGLALPELNHLPLCMIRPHRILALFLRRSPTGFRRAKVFLLQFSEKNALCLPSFIPF